MNSANIWIRRGVRLTKCDRLHTCKLDRVIFDNNLRAYCEVCLRPHILDLENDEKISVNNAINKFISKKKKTIGKLNLEL